MLNVASEILKKKIRLVEYEDLFSKKTSVSDQKNLINDLKRARMGGSEVRSQKSEEEPVVIRLSFASRHSVVIQLSFASLSFGCH